MGTEKTARGKLGEALARVGLVTAGFAVALLVLELVLRIVGLDAPAELDPSFDRPAVFYRPQAARMNPWATGQSDTLRIAVIGDSFTDGQGNHGYDAYPARLEALLNLNKGQRPAEVRIYAERGSPTRGQLKFLHRALEWGPDIVVLGIFLNDTERVNSRKLLARRRDLRPRVPKGRLAWVLRRSAVLAWTYQRLENARCSRDTMAYFQYIYDPEYEGFKQFARAIRTFRHLTKKDGVRLLAVVFPGMAANGADYRFEFAHERIREVLESSKVQSLDLREVYDGTMPLRMSAVPVVDSHPSEIAHRMAADAIFHRLLKDGAIDSGYRPNRRENKGRQYWLRETRRLKSVVHLAPKN